MLSEERLSVLRTFVQITVPLLQTHVHPNCCIPATRVACDVLPDFGFNVRPLVARVKIYNDAYQKLLATHGQCPTTPAAHRRWADEGAWQFWIGWGGPVTEPGAWAGHLAAVLDEQCLLDIGIIQACLRGKGIMAPPCLVEVTPEFLSGAAPAEAGFTGGDCRRCVGHWFAFPDERSYEQFSYWYDPETTSHVTQQVNDEMSRMIGSMLDSAPVYGGAASR